MKAMPTPAPTTANIALLDLRNAARDENLGTGTGTPVGAGVGVRPDCPTGVPHFLQNRDPAAFSLPQREQKTGETVSVTGIGAAGSRATAGATGSTGSGTPQRSQNVAP
jgi:hypothetical protein